VAYSSAPTVPYVWDDHLLIAGLGFPESLLGERLHAAWGPFLGIYFRPLTLSLLALELEAGSFAPLLSHSISLGLFLASVLALMSWLKTEQVTARSATLVGAVFATLPLATEAVLWTSARGDLAVLLFGLLALRKTAQRFPLRLWQGEAPGSTREVGVGAVLFFIVLALLSKETGVAVAAAVAVRAQWSTFVEQGRPGGRGVWTVLPLAIAGLFLLVRAQILPALPPPEMVAPEGLDRALLVLGTLATMVQHILWPFVSDLAIGTRGVPVVGDLSPLLGFVTVLVCGTLLVASRFGFVLRSGLAGVLFLVLLLPYSHILPIEIATRTADRYLLLPWVAAGLMLALGLDAVRRRFPTDLHSVRVFEIACVVVAVFGALSTWARVQDWQTEERFLRALHADADEGNGQPALVLGSWLANQGRCDEAVPLLVEAGTRLSLEGRNKSEAQARVGLADCLPLQDEAEAGLREARRAAALDPGASGAHARIVRSIRLTGRLDEAAREGELAVQLFPEDGAVAAELSRVLAAQLHFARARRLLETARSAVGLEGPSALTNEMEAAEQQVKNAQERISRGEAEGFEELAQLAERWGDPARAAELRASYNAQRSVD